MLANGAEIALNEKDIIATSLGDKIPTYHRISILTSLDFRQIGTQEISVIFRIGVLYNNLESVEQFDYVIMLNQCPWCVVGYFLGVRKKLARDYERF